MDEKMATNGARKQNLKKRRYLALYNLMTLIFNLLFKKTVLVELRKTMIKKGSLKKKVTLVHVKEIEISVRMELKLLKSDRTLKSYD